MYFCSKVSTHPTFIHGFKSRLLLAVLVLLFEQPWFCHIWHVSVWQVPVWAGLHIESHTAGDKCGPNWMNITQNGFCYCTHFLFSSLDENFHHCSQSLSENSNMHKYNNWIQDHGNVRPEDSWLVFSICRTESFVSLSSALIQYADKGPLWEDVAVTLACSSSLQWPVSLQLSCLSMPSSGN